MCTGSGAGSSGRFALLVQPWRKGMQYLFGLPICRRTLTCLKRPKHLLPKYDCTKLWDWSYHELLVKLHLPTLTQRRLHINLCLMYKIIHGLMYFPPVDVVTPSTTVTHNPRSLLLQEPFAQTNAYKYSFYLGQHLTGTHYLIMLFCHPHLVVLSIVYHCTRCSWGTLYY